MKDFREVCYPMQCQPSSPQLSSVGSATACAQCTLFIKYPLPLLVACGLIENAPEEWWVCPFLICFLIWVSRPPIWTFRKVKRSFLSWLLHAVLVIVFPHPSWCFTVTTSLLFSLEKPSVPCIVKASLGAKKTRGFLVMAEINWKGWISEDQITCKLHIQQNLEDAAVDKTGGLEV